MPFGPSALFFFTKDTKTLCGTTSFPKIGVFAKYWQDLMPLSIRIPKSHLITWYVFVYSRLLLDLDS